MLRGTSASRAPVILAQSGVPSALTGTTAETTLATITIPGGMMGPNGSLRIQFEFSNTNNANLKTYRMYYGGLSGYGFFGQTVTTSATGLVDRGFRNRNSVSVQISPGTGLFGPGVTGGAMITGAVNSNNDQQLIITGQLAVGTDTFTLEGYTVEVLPTPS